MYTYAHVCIHTNGRRRNGNDPSCPFPSATSRRRRRGPRARPDMICYNNMNEHHYVCIYIYVERERYINICMYIYIYI